MSSNKDFKRLKKFQNIDFGIYLNLVECIIYDTECVKSRYEDTQKRFLKRKRNARLLFVFFILTTIIFPLFLLIATYSQASTPEIVLYFFWLLLGLGLLKSQRELFKFTSVNANKEISSLNRGYNFCIKYIQETLTTFYNKDEAFTTLTNGMPDEEFEELKNWILALEMDFTVFTDHVYKNNRLNNLTEPKELESTQSRLESQNFLNKYLNDLVIRTS